MSKVSKRKDRNYWQFTYKDSKGKVKKRGGFRTKKEAEIAQQKFFKANNIDVEDWVAVDYFWHYIEVNNVKETLSKKSYEHYDRSIRIFENYYGRKKLRDISRLDYQKMLNDYGKTRTTETVRKLHNNISKMLKVARYEGLIDKLPTFQVKPLGFVPAKQSEDKYLEVEDYLKLIHFTRNSFIDTHSVIFLLAITGARIGEILNLEYRDLRERTVHIRGTKTKYSDRVVTISNNDMETIRELVEDTRDEKNEKDKIFNVSNQGVSRALKTIAKNLGIDKPINPHMLRHTHASYLLMNDVRIEYISRRLGHSNITVTYSIYSHILKEFSDEQDEIIESIF